MSSPSCRQNAGCAAAIAVCLTLAALPAQAGAGSHLDRALAAAAPAGAPVPVWVYFADRPLDGPARAAALDRARAALPPRVLARRAKVAMPGAALVDEADLPVPAPYLAAVAATGATRRCESRWLNAASFAATADQVARILELPFVVRVDGVARFRRPDPPLTPLAPAAGKSATDWSIDYGQSLAALEQIAVPIVHELGYTGAGVVIGMLDSGFRTTHEALDDIVVLAAHDFINDDDIVENEPGDPAGQHNHGTVTLSNAMGNQPGALVGPAFGAAALLAKTEDTSQEAPIEEDWWVAGLEWLESRGADVISSSLGYTDWYSFSELDGNTAVTTIAADLAAERGLCVVNSSGNNGQAGHINAPADGDAVIAVGAVNSTGQLATFSSPGPTFDGRIKPDVCARGVNNAAANPADDHAYVTASGTSLSCPLAAAVAALVLERAPLLTPAQVREALRETADRADAPDNQYGWGILDAAAAVTYWGPRIVHQPLADSEDLDGPYVVDATITDRLTLQPAQLELAYRRDGSRWVHVPLEPAGGDHHTALIPGTGAPALIEYYVQAIDAQGLMIRDPLLAPAEVHAFDVGADREPPVIVHHPLGRQPLAVWPPLVTTQVTDEMGVDRVELDWRVDGGAWQGPVAVPRGEGDAYALPFPAAADDLPSGAVVTYTLTAWDLAAAVNSATDGPHEFAVYASAPIVLIDEGGADALAPLLQAANLAADRLLPAALEPHLLSAYALAVVAAGRNASAFASSPLRELLVDRVGAGGKVFVEGGHVGWSVFGPLEDRNFGREVLRCTAWRADHVGPLNLVEGRRDHPVLSFPHLIATPVAVATSVYAQDTCTPLAAEELLLAPANWSQSAGLLVHDDNDDPHGAQLAFLACSVDALAVDVAAALVENVVTYLLVDEANPTATIVGTVDLAGATDLAGTVVSAGDVAATTAADGGYELGPLFGGPHRIVVTRAGFVPQRRVVAVAHGGRLDDVDFTLAAAAQVTVVDAAEATIPAGVASLVRVLPVERGGACGALEVAIDLAHPDIGDLQISLLAPTGASVRLHDRSGSGTADLVGRWPVSLPVDGPGSLDDLVGVDIRGNWTLAVTNAGGGEAGVLHAWSLDLVVPADVVAVTRLAGNWPNPFNPGTTIGVDLARAGRVRLELFDVRGRRVRRLLDEDRDAGRHEVPWDGRDGDGRTLASGTYLCRLEAGGVTQSRPMLLAR